MPARVNSSISFTPCYRREIKAKIGISERPSRPKKRHLHGQKDTCHGALFQAKICATSTVAAHSLTVAICHQDAGSPHFESNREVPKPYENW